MQGTKTRFYYSNILGSTGSTIVATSTSTAASYAIDNVWNWLETNRWMASSSATQNLTYDAGAGNTKNADYMVLAGHNLYTAGATITLQGSTTSAFAGEQSTLFSQTATADTIFLKEFTTSAAKRYWRIILSGQTTACYISIASVGTYTELDYLQAPFDPDMQNVEAKINKSYGGYITGIHTAFAERQFALNFPAASTTLYSQIKTWWANCGLNNFALAWDSTGNPADVWLVHADTRFNNPITADFFRNININLTGRKE